MPEDFIETNIIIGYTVDWDRQSSVVQQYVEVRAGGVDLHTSSRVIAEAEDVISDRRRLAKQAARRIFQDFSASGRHPPVDQVVDFVRGELSHKRDVAVDHVIQHIKDNEYYYTGLTQTDSTNALQRTASDIDSDFDGAVAVVRSIRNHTCSELACTIFTDGLNDYSCYSVFSNVNQILSNSPNDRDILMDSYHLTQENGIGDLYFVTMDGDLLDNEGQLESLLNTIDIESPELIS
jgi:hypothetical protein